MDCQRIEFMRNLKTKLIYAYRYFIIGGLGYKVLYDLFKQIEKPVFIASDSNSEYVIDYAKQNFVPVFIGNPRGRKLVEFLDKHQIEVDLVLSINYLFLLDIELIDYLPLTINIHGSLLPKYRGRTPHIWSIINGEKEAGITAHIIDADCDTGDILKQIVVPIENDDTGAKILEKYEELYPKLLLSVLNDVKSNKIQRTQQDDSKATYFGKRTPDDGLIDWNWHKERIRNWVRAQAYPYPGAFSFLDGKKVFIDNVEYSDEGFSDHTENGTILKIQGNPIVKCPNGALEFKQVRNQDVLKKFKSNKLLK